MDEFFRRYTGYEQAPDIETRSGPCGWMSIPIPALRTVTNGEIFTDRWVNLQKKRDLCSVSERCASAEACHVIGVMAAGGQYKLWTDAQTKAIRRQRGCVSANL